MIAHMLNAAPVGDPSWYDIEFVQMPATGINLYDNSLDVWRAQLTDIHFFQLLTSLRQSVPPGYENLRISFTTPGGIFRFFKVSDTTRWMDVSLRMQHGACDDQIIESQTTYPIEAGGVGSAPTETNLYMDIFFDPSNQGQRWRGDYYFPLQIHVFDTNDNLLVDRTLQMTVHFREQDSPVPPVTTMTVSQYPAAQDIPFQYPYQSGQPVIKVGGVNFQSNEGYNTYWLRISPVGQSYFQFSHTNASLGRVIRYRVTIPDRTTVAFEQAFEFNLDYKGVVGNWYDFLEVGVRDINYTNSRGSAGDYASTIRIDLVSF